MIDDVVVRWRALVRRGGRVMGCVVVIVLFWDGRERGRSKEAELHQQGWLEIVRVGG